MSDGGLLLLLLLLLYFIRNYFKEYEFQHKNFNEGRKILFWHLMKKRWYSSVVLLLRFRNPLTCCSPSVNNNDNNNSCLYWHFENFNVYIYLVKVTLFYQQYNKVYIRRILDAIHITVEASSNTTNFLSYACICYYNRIIIHNLSMILHNRISF